MQQIEIEKYDGAHCEHHCEQWNAFVRNSANGTFLFIREYMDYHSDRFEDWSLMVLQKNKIIAVLPATRHGSAIVSHGGLTYGGLIVGTKMTTIKVMAIFAELKRYLTANGFNRLVYKTIPHIYHKLCCESDLYALFRSGAVLKRRDISSAVNNQNRATISNGKKQRIRKLKNKGLTVCRSNEFNDFMGIVRSNLLQKFGKEPTHSAEEMNMLADRFPENIKLFTLRDKDCILAGSIVYETEKVAHAQYLASTRQGQEIGGLDYVLDYLINNYYSETNYFDFGISTEENGYVLNEGLIKQKEEFGARGVVYDTYEIEISNAID